MKWFEILQVSLIQLQLKANECDPSLFTYFSNGHTIYILVYVEDIILIDNSTSLLQDIITILNMAFSFNHLGDLY